MSCNCIGADKCTNMDCDLVKKARGWTLQPPPRTVNGLVSVLPAYYPPQSYRFADAWCPICGKKIETTGMTCCSPYVSYRLMYQGGCWRQE